MELSQLPLVFLLISNIHSGHNEDIPKPTLTVLQKSLLFSGDSVTLRCEVDQSWDVWEFLWSKNSNHESTEGEIKTINSVKVSDRGEYRCRARIGGHYTHYSEPVTVTIYDIPKPTLTVLPQSSLFTGDSVTLRCEVNQSWDHLEFLWSKNSNIESTEAATKTIKSVKVSDGGEYRCRAQRGGHYTYYSKPVTLTIYGKPKSKVTIKPDQHVFRGETVTLRCDMDDSEGVTSWQYSWYKESSASVFSKLQEHTFSFVTESDAGKYSCYGVERGGSLRSHRSNKVTLRVSDRAQAVLSVSPQKWLTEGDSVTLICKVYGSSTGWTFSWYTVSSGNRYHYELPSDSSRGAGGNYTVSSAALNHTGVYVCTAERGNLVYNTTYSNKQPLWVTGVSLPVSLIISPSRSQHFTSVFLSLSCEDQSNSDRWTVRRYTDSWWLEDCSSSDWGSQTGSTCTISSTSTSDTGVYWCQSESEENSHSVNITVHSGVILESPVHPVTEGETMTLRCIYEYASPPYIRADFYKDGSLIQNQTTEMIISNVSKSHEGFYYCKHPERGESPSWISVTASSRTSRSDGLNLVIIGVTAGLTVTFLIIVFSTLLWCYRNNKGERSQSPSSVSQHQNSSQTSEQNQSEAGNNTLLSGDAHIYESVDTTINNGKVTDCLSGPSEHIYAEIELRSTSLLGKTSKSSDTVYSKLTLVTYQGPGSSDVTCTRVK
ncbi:leukocyte immunoglobulin-like receptor subfamily A member 2 [Garra rufa]|uniref:leukocyte immunoglobulin-like receptor subfamily A member 2 n=1 Tax=Garra rufa TaxID=137080 RepID=UPI003CCEB035